MAAKQDCWYFVVAACSFLISTVQAGSYCLQSSSYTYCSSGCCGNYGNEYCCNNVVVWIVIGSVLAVLAVVSVVVILICYCIKKKGKPGRVIQPMPTTTTSTVVYTGGAVHYQGPPPQYGMQPMGAQPVQPPMYSAQSAPPPAYNYDPAYPPPVQPQQPAPAPGYGGPKY